jgi:hypothetical protein
MMTVSAEMKNEQRGMLHRTRLLRIAFVIIVVCAFEFLRNYEPFQSHFWILFLASLVTMTIGWIFIDWIDGKRQGG